MRSVPVEKYRKSLGELNDSLSDEQVTNIGHTLEEFINVVWELYDEHAKSGNLL